MSRRGEKKILDIKWSPSTRDRLEIVVPVHAITTRDYDSGKEILTFRAVYHPASIHVENVNINLLKEEVVALLKAWYTIEWDLYIKVEIDGGGNYSQEGPGCKIEVDTTFYVVGKDVNGTVRHMRIPPVADVSKWDPKKPGQWSGEAPRDGWLETGKPDRSGRYNARSATTSLVKATEANVIALINFVAAMNALLEKMHHHFAPERIENLLASSLSLLQAPDAKQKKGDK